MVNNVFSLLDALLQTSENQHLSKDPKLVYFVSVIYNLLFAYRFFFSFMAYGVRQGLVCVFSFFFFFFCALEEPSPVDKNSHGNKLAA